MNGERAGTADVLELLNCDGNSPRLVALSAAAILKLTQRVVGYLLSGLYTLSNLDCRMLSPSFDCGSLVVAVTVMKPLAVALLL